MNVDLKKQLRSEAADTNIDHVSQAYHLQAAERIAELEAALKDAHAAGEAFGRAAEREACAKIAEEAYNMAGQMIGWGDASDHILAAIRARAA